MGRLRIHAKVLRVETFISSLRNPAIRPRMASYGLTDEILAQGEELAKTARHRVLDQPVTIRKTDVVARVGAWSKEWMPVIEASLRFDHPAVHERLFRGIERGQDEAALPHVLTLAERLLDLVASQDAEDQAAFALLGQRGVTEAGVAGIADLIRTGERFTVTGPTREERDGALAAAWNFYLVWSAIARTAIKEKALLRRMGFRRKSPVAAEDPASPAPAAPTAAPAADAAPAAPPADPAPAPAVPTAGEGGDHGHA